MEERNLEKRNCFNCGCVEDCTIFESVPSAVNIHDFNCTLHKFKVSKPELPEKLDEDENWPTKYGELARNLNKINDYLKAREDRDNDSGYAMSA